MTTRVAISGCGHRSRTVWQRHILAADSAELVGVQDPDPASFQKLPPESALDERLCHADLQAMLDAVRPDALLVCTVNDAHAPAIAAGLAAGCHVLVEKPFTTNLDDAVRLAETAARQRRVLAVVQNWRTKAVGQAMAAAIARGTIGPVSHIFFRYLRDREMPHLPAYLFSETDPVLMAMAIHHFDLFRYVLGEEIVSVAGHDFRPAWSRYENPSGMQLWMETEGRVKISYVATFSSRNGHLPLESMQVEGELGTLHNESQYSEPPLWLSRRGDEAMIDLTSDVNVRDVAGQYDLADSAVLMTFLEAITEGSPPVSPASENLGTMAVIEAVRLALKETRTVDPRELLATSRESQHA